MKKAITAIASMSLALIATAEKPTYIAEFKFYAVEGDIQLTSSPQTLDTIRDYAETPEEIAAALDKSVSLVFNDIHLAPLLRQLSGVYKLRFMLDTNTVQPENAIPVEDGEHRYVTDGQIEFVNLHEVSLRQSLKAVLRPVNLQFIEEPGYVFITALENKNITPPDLSEDFFKNQNPKDAIFDTYRIIDGSIPLDQVVMGDTILRLDGSELIWTGTPVSESDHITFISAPSFHTLPKRESTIRIGSETPVKFFQPIESDDETEAAPGDRFTYETGHIETGLTLDIKLHETKPDNFDMEYKIAFALINEDSESDLPIGKPETRSISGRGVIQLTPRQWAARWISTYDNENILMLFNVKKAPNENESF